MINGAEVLALAQSGQARPDWRILPAKKSFFIQNLLTYGLLALVVLGGALYLAMTPDVAIAPKFTPRTLDDDSLNLWRTIDFVVAALLFFLFGWQVLQAGKDISTAASQMLIMLPQGLVVRKGDKPAQVFEYATLKGFQVSKIQRGEATLKMDNMQTGKVEQFELDACFGKIQPVTQDLVAAYQAYHAYHTQQPR